MMERIGPSLLLLVLLQAPVALRDVSAAETAQMFLDGLKQRGYYDEALDFLKKARQDELVAEEFRERIDVEMGAVLIEQCRLAKDDETRDALLQRAIGLLNKYRDREGAENGAKAAAALQLANAKVARARLLVKRKELPEARLMYVEAVIAAEDAGLLLHDQLAQLPKVLDPRGNRKLLDQRNKWRAEYLSAQLLVPATQEEAADTWSDVSDIEREAMLEKAIKGYEDVYKKYRTRLAGLYARFYEGRSYRKLDRLDRCLSIMRELLDQPKAMPALRSVRLMALAEALECHVDPRRAEYVEAAARGGQEIKAMTAAEAASAEGRRIKRLVKQANANVDR